MAMCKGCGDVVASTEIKDGYCEKCSSPDVVEKREKTNARAEDVEKNRDIINSVMATTETFIDGEIEERIGIVFAHRVYGLNIVKDFFASIRDIVGGRVKSIEGSIDQTNVEIMDELKEKAYKMGGNTVIGVTVNYSTTIQFLSVVATGTVVKIREN